MVIIVPDKKDTLLFYGNASSRIGAGHVMRLLAVAQTAIQNGYLAYFVYRCCAAPLLKKLADNGIQTSAMGAHSFSEMVKRLAATGLFLDDYELTNADWQDIETIHVPVAVFDDQLSDISLPVNLVINPASDGSQKYYQVRAPSATLCLGSDFTILRREFTDSAQQLPEIKRRKHILVTLGAADIKGLAMPIVAGLLRHLPVTTIELAIGGLTHYNQAELDRLRGEYPNLKVHINSDNMALVMRQAGLAISAAGGTLGELASQGVPTFALVCADNQLPALTSSLNRTWYQAFDFRHYAIGDDISEFISQSLQLWDNLKSRQAMSIQAQKTVDLKGCKRVLEQFEGRLAAAKQSTKIIVP